MAYGQTGTGKTFTLGQLGEEDTSDRGIMVCSMEDILADISLGIDFVTVSYLQVAYFYACITIFYIMCIVCHTSCIVYIVIDRKSTRLNSSHSSPSRMPSSA